MKCVELSTPPPLHIFLSRNNYMKDRQSVFLFFFFNHTLPFCICCPHNRCKISRVYLLNAKRDDHNFRASHVLQSVSGCGFYVWMFVLPTTTAQHHKTHENPFDTSPVYNRRCTEAVQKHLSGSCFKWVATNQFLNIINFRGDRFASKPSRLIVTDVSCLQKGEHQYCLY